MVFRLLSTRGLTVIVKRSDSFRRATPLCNMRFYFETIGCHLSFDIFLTLF